MLRGRLSGASALGGALSGGAGLKGTLMSEGGAFFPRCEGAYEFEPNGTAQAVRTGYSSNARGLLTNGRTYTYTFIKWT